ncbi:MAG TPA: hypothetical protein VD902_11520, partial [Symbiobacteriaceae bacterium]|nr:hypothetical protein [Symbiobacteriaceae bacterium]
PLYAFHLSAPATAAGRIMGELIHLRAVLGAPVQEGERMLLEGTLPVAGSLDFPARLSGLTGGRGFLSTWPGGYRPAPQDVQAIRTRDGVDPADRAKYLLALRGAL